jgi:hypothetical protein
MDAEKPVSWDELAAKTWGDIGAPSSRDETEHIGFRNFEHTHELGDEFNALIAEVETLKARVDRLEEHEVANTKLIKGMFDPT